MSDIERMIDWQVKRRKQERIYQDIEFTVEIMMIVFCLLVLISAVSLWVGLC
jgi:hypothetical protein